MCVCCACSAESDGVSACVRGELYLPLPCGPVHSWPFTVYSLQSPVFPVMCKFCLRCFLRPSICRFRIFAFSFSLAAKQKTENCKQREKKSESAFISFWTTHHTPLEIRAVSAVITTLPLPERCGPQSSETHCVDIHPAECIDQRYI